MTIHQLAAQNYFPECKAIQDGPEWVILDGKGDWIGRGATEEEAWTGAAWTAVFLDSYKATGDFVPFHAEEPVDEESTWSTVFAVVILGAGGWRSSRPSSAVATSSIHSCGSWRIWPSTALAYLPRAACRSCLRWACGGVGVYDDDTLHSRTQSMVLRYRVWTQGYSRNSHPLQNTRYLQTVPSQDFKGV